jgi:hypothetical protein
LFSNMMKLCVWVFLNFFILELNEIYNEINHLHNQGIDLKNIVSKTKGKCISLNINL